MSLSLPLPLFAYPSRLASLSSTLASRMARDRQPRVEGSRATVGAQFRLLSRIEPYLNGTAVSMRRHGHGAARVGMDAAAHRYRAQSCATTFAYLCTT